MSVREFAAHLGVSDRMVSKWEAGGDAIRPRPLNQSALDTSLALAGPDVRNRFTHISTGPDMPAQRRRPVVPNAVKQVPEHAIHFVRHPLDSKLMTLVDSGPFRIGSGRKPIWLPGFYIDVYATTNAEYARFLAATGQRPPTHWPDGLYTIADDQDALHDDPVVDLSWEDAAAYAYWATKDIAAGQQWDRATRGREGTVLGELWEWVRCDAGPGRRGPKAGQGGGFRCTADAQAVLALLAI